MDVKKYLISTLVGFIVIFFLGWLGHQVILPIFQSGADPMEPVMRSEPNMIGIAVATLILSLLMAYMYPKGVEGRSKAGNGFRFGALIGLVYSVPISIIFFSTLEGITITMILSEAVWHIIEEGAAGVAIAYAYGIPSTESS